MACSGSGRWAARACFRRKGARRANRSVRFSNVYASCDNRNAIKKGWSDGRSLVLTCRERKRRGVAGRFLLLSLAAFCRYPFFGGRTARCRITWRCSGSIRSATGEVLWKTLSLQWGIFTAFCGSHVFSFCSDRFLALKRAHLPDLPSGHTIFIGGTAAEAAG